RQRLLWREARSRLAAMPAPAAARYAALDARAEVVSLLRADYGRDDAVREVVDGVVTDLVFLGRTNGTFEALGMSNAPRGLRWWWSALTGEEATGPASPAVPAKRSQLSFDDLGDLDPHVA